VTASKMLDKVSALLSKAENTDNEAEAEAYFEAAQRIAASNSIDLAVARMHNKTKQAPETPIRRQIIMGERGKRYLADRVELFDAIAGPNGVRIDIAHNSTYVNAYGFPSDVDMVEALFSSLVIQMVKSGDAYIKSGEYKVEMVCQTRAVYEYEENYWGGKRRVFSHYETVEKPVHGAVARRSFYRGFAGKIRQRITEIVAKAKAEAESAEDLVVGTSAVEVIEHQSTGTELALASRDLAVKDFYKETSRARGSWKGGRSSGYSGNARSAGNTAGANARIGSQGALSGSRTALGA
jgi:hypothetical protein